MPTLICFSALDEMCPSYVEAGGPLLERSAAHRAPKGRTDIFVAIRSKLRRGIATHKPTPVNSTSYEEASCAGSSP
jgi:hypothetical protein